MRIALAALLTTMTIAQSSSQPQPAAGQSGFFDVKLYGAAGDGSAIESGAINRAIDAAAAAGGGTVYFPAGQYLTGAIRLKSNICLFIDQGATIIAAPVTAGNGYDEEEPGSGNAYQDQGHSHWHNSLIWGEGIHDVSIVGPGTIWGKGLYRDWVDSRQSANKSIALIRCRNIILRDFSVLHGGWFAILATGVDNITLDNVTMDTNRDGVDFDCCRNVRVANCHVNSPFDDGICLKSSFALGEARATENVTITNCALSGYDEGTLIDGTFRRGGNSEYRDHPTGRIKFGTESNGGFRGITISNCVFDHCRGLALETVDGGILEDVAINNIVMRDIVNDPIFLRLGARMRGPAHTPVGVLRRVIISDVIVYNADPGYSCTISGIPGHCIEDVGLSNIRLYYRGGARADSARHVPEQENKYPEPGMFGPAPAYGFFIRHARDVRMNDVEIRWLSEDARAPFVLDDVRGIEMVRVNAQKREDGAWCTMNDVSDFRIAQRRDGEDRYIGNVSQGEVK